MIAAIGIVIIWFYSLMKKHCRQSTSDTSDTSDTNDTSDISDTTPMATGHLVLSVPENVDVIGIQESEEILN